MIRIVLPAMADATTTSTATTIKATTWVSSLWHDERRGAPDLNDLDLLAGGDHLFLVKRARGPHLAADLHRPDTFAVCDPLDDERRLTDQRGGAGAQRRRGLAVTDRDRTQQQQKQDRRRREGDDRHQTAGASCRQHGRDRTTNRERCEVERVRVQLAQGDS